MIDRLLQWLSKIWPDESCVDEDFWRATAAARSHTRALGGFHESE